MELSAGDEIRLDKIVRIEDKPAPRYDKNYFACDI
jgi:Rho-binding antiterminator